MVRLYVVCYSKSLAGTSVDVFVKLPGATHPQAEALFPQKRAAAVFDFRAGGCPVPVQGVGEVLRFLFGILAAGFEVVNGSGWNSDVRGFRARLSTVRLEGA